MTIGEKIKYFRTQKGLTQEQLGNMAGIHPVTIRKYELNKIHPTPAQIEKISDILGISSIILTGVNNSGLRVETLGDLIAALMVLYNVGFISILGERNADNKLTKETAKICLHPHIFPGCKLILVEETPNHEYSDIFLTRAIKHEDILNQFLEWERHRYMYKSFLEECDPHDIATQDALKKYERTICMIELELQKTKILLNGF